MTSIGYATLDVIPSFKDLSRELDRGTAGPMRSAGTRGGAAFGDSAGKAAGGRFGSIFSKAARAALVGVGVGAGVAFKVGKDSIKEASDLGESLNAVNVTFGKQAKGVKRLGRDAADSLGLSNSAFNGLAVQYSAFARTIGGDKKTVKTLDDLTTRAADFASVMNLEVAESAGLFQSGLAGETEPLRRFGIDLSAAAVESYAYANGIADVGDKLTESEKVQARYGSLMEQTAKTQGDFANTSDSLANRQRVLSARWDDARAKLGQGLLPIMEDAAGFLLDKGIPAFERFSDWFVEKGIPNFKDFRDQIRPLSDQLIPAMAGALEVARDALEDAVPFAKDVVEAFNNLPDGVKKGLIVGGGVYLGSKALGGGGGNGGPSLGPGGLLSATKGAVVTKSGELLADRLLAKFQRPLPVVVTNPGFGAGGGPGGGASGGGKGGAGRLLLGSVTSIAIAGAATVAIEKVSSKLAPETTANGNFGTPGAVVKPDTNKDGGIIDMTGFLGVKDKDGKTPAEKVDELRSKMALFGDEADLVGAKKINPSLTVPGLKKANEDFAKFIGYQIEAGKPVTPYINTTSIERAIALAQTLDASLPGNSNSNAGVDNGAGYMSGGTGASGRGGVNINIENLTAADYRDFIKKADSSSRRRGHGGFAR